MKYWNKQKHLRERSWTKVSLPRDPHIPNLFPYYDGWINWSDFNQLKHDLQMHKSDGKFYMTIRHKDIWFEKEKDATMFILRWL